MLIIFVDALPYAKRALLPRIAEVLPISPLKPGLGYSVNLHAELFWGKTPDQLGYFGEWAALPGRRAAAGSLPKLERNALPLFRIGQLFNKKILRRGGDYIPLSFRDAFVKKGVYPLTRPDIRHGVFHARAFEYLVGDSVRASLGERDEIIWRRFRDYGNGIPRNLVVSLCDLDGTFHEHGVEGAEVSAKFAWLDRVVPEMFRRYAAAHPGEAVFLMSDHGIAEGRQGVNVPLREWLQCAQETAGLFFFDSLYLSVWGSELGVLIERFFEKQPVAIRFTGAERVKYGVTQDTFGDDLWLLKEGHYFNPNFFGFRALKSYHGYDPDLERSQGVFGASNRSEVRPATTLEVSKVLIDAANN